MNKPDLLHAQKQHLAGLLEAIQRCVYFLNASDSAIEWPLTGEYLSSKKKDNDLFEALAAINERFSKLQDMGRNTAPALTLAALAALQNGQDPVLVVTPADQTVANPAAFTAAMQRAITQAATGSIVILGVTPTHPETGYGYIQTENGRSEALVAMPLNVQAFVEKPNAATAQQYLEAGNYFWNAGMFVLKASVWLQALEQFRPDIAQATRQAWDMQKRQDTPGRL